MYSIEGQHTPVFSSFDESTKREPENETGEIQSPRNEKEQTNTSPVYQTNDDRHSKEPVQNHRENGGTAEIQYGRPGRLDFVRPSLSAAPALPLPEYQNRKTEAKSKALVSRGLQSATARTVIPVEPIQERLERLITALKDDRMKVA